MRDADPIGHMLAVASAASSEADESALSDILARHPALGALLLCRNGFCAFEGALEVFGVGASTDSVEIREWNFGADSWRHLYAGVPPTSIAFAHDVFAYQYLLNADGGVSFFDPETGEASTFAADMGEWASNVMEDYRLHTGWPIARAWQRLHGALLAGWRLAPKKPFIFGGDYAVENLRAVPATRAMMLYASVYAAALGRADGEQILWADPLLDDAVE